MTVPLLRYTAARIALFVMCLGLLTVATGIRGAAAVLIALVLSALLSALLLTRQRDAIAEAAEARRAQKQDLRSKLAEDEG